MPPQWTCPECGALWDEGMTCENAFHQMLYWENEDPTKGTVHHLMVLGYHLQHPGLYSPDGLAYSLQLLVDFLEHEVTPQQARNSAPSGVDSSKRTWKIRGKPGAQGAYLHPVRWRMTAQDVVNSGTERYTMQVQAWVRSILADLRASGNLD